MEYDLAADYNNWNGNCSTVSCHVARCEWRV